VLYTSVCLCSSVCLSQVNVLLKGLMHDSNFLRLKVLMTFSGVTHLWVIQTGVPYTHGVRKVPM